MYIQIPIEYQGNASEIRECDIRRAIQHQANELIEHIIQQPRQNKDLHFYFLIPRLSSSISRDDASPLDMGMEPLDTLNPTASIYPFTLSAESTETHERRSNVSFIESNTLLIPEGGLWHFVCSIAHDIFRRHPTSAKQQSTFQISLLTPAPLKLTGPTSDYRPENFYNHVISRLNAGAIILSLNATPYQSHKKSSNPLSAIFIGDLNFSPISDASTSTWTSEERTTYDDPILLELLKQYHRRPSSLRIPNQVSLDGQSDDKHTAAEHWPESVFLPTKPPQHPDSDSDADSHEQIDLDHRKKQRSHAQHASTSKPTPTVRKRLRHRFLLAPSAPAPSTASAPSASSRLSTESTHFASSAHPIRSYYPTPPAQLPAPPSSPVSDPELYLDL